MFYKEKNNLLKFLMIILCEIKLKVLINCHCHCHCPCISFEIIYFKM